MLAWHVRTNGTEDLLLFRSCIYLLPDSGHAYEFQYVIM